MLDIDTISYLVEILCLSRDVQTPVSFQAFRQNNSKVLKSLVFLSFNFYNLNYEMNEIQFDREVQLGEGGYGAVFLGTFRGRKVAVKRVLVIDATNENEEKIMQQLNHPNVVKLFHFYIENDYK